MDSSSQSSSATTKLEEASDRYSFNPRLRWNPEVEEYFIKAYGAEHFAQISKSLTHPSSYSCIRVNTLKSTGDTIIRKLMTLLDENKLSSRIKHTKIEVDNADSEVEQAQEGNKVSNVQTTKIFGDGANPEGDIQNLSISKCQYPGLDDVVFVKGSGPHKFDYGSQPIKEIIVSRKCAEAVLRGAQVFVPGVLACSAHVEEGDMVVVSVAVEQPCPDGKWGVGITRGIVLQGINSDPHYQARSGLYIGKGNAMMSRTGIFRASHGIAVAMLNRIYDLPSFHNVLEGEIFLQNLPSVVAAHVLDPKQGERILDMCAAPGGKTTAIAILMKDQGEIVAMDRSHNKVMDIANLAAEMGLTCIRTYKLDALKSVCLNSDTREDDNKVLNNENIIVAADSRSTNDDTVTNNAEKCKSKEFQTGNGRYLSKADLRKDMRRKRNGPGRSNGIGSRAERSKGFLPNSFDRILLDAPCSALGLKPRLFVGEETMETLQKNARYQRKMFDQAVQLVRSGGVIVYSTCTLNPGENEALVRYALDKYKFLSLSPQNPRIGGPGLVGHCELLGGKHREEWLSKSEAELVQRFDPSSSLDTIGFFIAKFNVCEKNT